jgi:GDPmannose 4,6-dehydratase
VANYREAYGIQACTGILFNHESPLRPVRFVTRKIVSTACRISKGSREKLSLGDLSIRRDWGWAPEYVSAMWAMLNSPATMADHVIATGQSHTLEQFVARAFECLELDWRDHVETDASLRRPTEISFSRGDASKACKVLGWSAARGMNDVVAELVREELAAKE